MRAARRRIVHTEGIEGARRARGVAVVIDVFRAFTVSAYALAGGATRSLLVADVEQARLLAEEIPGSVISAEIDGLPVEGIPISNSPTMITQADLKGRTLIQRTSTGTQAAVAASSADLILAASLVVARATADHIRELDPTQVTLVATGAPAGDLEDCACAEYLGALLRDQEANLEELLEPLRATERYQYLRTGRKPGFPASDLDLALAADRFAFAMLVTSQDGVLQLCRSSRSSPAVEPGRLTIE